ncbi:TM2 domain-containing protein [Mycoplasma sp. Ms02]|uniref:TM2 domain-containing protein n=1 Tax=Mycoplasma sp. Ms02 TaxID=353851 RepID=UPI001C88F0DA|nr:TM2 domain-containing protein [Mycoplasma sp. Ms02]QZE12239.1 TM2 domain-containing protein [Mycoplasma sp. Ms02]
MENQFNYSPVSNKSRLALVLLSWFLGAFGVDRIYAGSIVLGILKLIFGWFTFGIWWLVDFILAVAGKMKDSDGNYISQW